MRPQNHEGSKFYVQKRLCCEVVLPRTLDGEAGISSPSKTPHRFNKRSKGGNAAPVSLGFCGHIHLIAQLPRKYLELPQSESNFKQPFQQLTIRDERSYRSESIVFWTSSCSSPRFEASAAACDRANVNILPPKSHRH